MLVLAPFSFAFMGPSVRLSAPSAGVSKVSMNLFDNFGRTDGVSKVSTPRPEETLGSNMPNPLRSVQDGKDDFQTSWGTGAFGAWGAGTRPLPMSTQAFVNEMITTVTVAQASANYEYSSIFGLGYETLVSYYTLEVRSEEAKEKCRVALAEALLRDPAQMKADAEELKAAATGKTVEELFETAEFKRLAGLDGKFKYTYVFGVGLMQLMQLVEPKVEIVEGASAWTKKLGLPCENQATRDATYFKKQMEKLQLMKDMFDQMKAAAERKAANPDARDPRSISNTK
jgi:hypothetical protein